MTSTLPTPRGGLDHLLTELLGRDPLPKIESLLGSAEDEGWRISRAFGTYLGAIVLTLGRRSVLEFGAGRSSLVVATALDEIGGGRLTSVEHQPEFCRDDWASVAEIKSVDARLCEASLQLRATRHGLMYAYRHVERMIKPRAPYDLVVIDAPPGKFGRDSPMYDAYPLLADGALIILDDAARPAEQTAVRRWLRTFPGLRVVVSAMSHGCGTVVLEHSGNKRRRFSARAVLGTLHDRLISGVGRD
jgi:predicted O-methyltransferase YrrM